MFEQDESSAGGDCGKSHRRLILELQSGDPPPYLLYWEISFKRQLSKPRQPDLKELSNHMKDLKQRNIRAKGRPVRRAKAKEVLATP